MNDFYQWRPFKIQDLFRRVDICIILEENGDGVGVPIPASKHQGCNSVLNTNKSFGEDEMNGCEKFDSQCKIVKSTRAKY
jgi:hypothetical protein